MILEVTHMLSRPFQILLAALLGCFAMTLMADSNRQDSFVFSGSYVRASMPGQTVGAAYIHIHNRGATDDYLIAAHSPVAASVDLHSSHMQQGMAHMQRESRLPVPAGGQLDMKPGGIHLMLQGLKHPLKEGEQIPVQLVFEKAGTLALTLPVRSVLSPSGQGAMPEGMSMHGSMNGPMQESPAH